jgi:hypothetical protein
VEAASKLSGNGVTQFENAKMHENHALHQLPRRLPVVTKQRNHQPLTLKTYFNGRAFSSYVTIFKPLLKGCLRIIKGDKQPCKKRPNHDITALCTTNRIRQL